MTGSNHVPLFLRIMDNRNFLPALSMELLFSVDALRNDLMLLTIRFLILVFLKAVFIRDIMNQLVSKLVCLGVLRLNTPSTSNLNLHQKILLTS